MKLPASCLVIVIACFVICSCTSTKQTTYSMEFSKTFFPCSLLIETKAGHPCVNDVIDACQRVKQFREIIVNELNNDRIEIKIIYDGLSHSEKEQLLNYIYELSDTRVINISG